jgi:hypothetical protein
MVPAALFLETKLQRWTIPPKMGMFFKRSPRMGPEIGQFQTRHQNASKALLLDIA